MKLAIDPDSQRRKFQDTILCVSNAYEQIYYLNDEFEALPEGIKDELKIVSVLFTEDIGGIFVISFNEDGELYFEVQSDEGDLMYDEIGSHLKVKELRKTKKELWQSLETFFKVFYLGQEFND